MKSYEFIEDRLVFSNESEVWNLLTNCNYLSEWMPFVARVEHLGKDSLSKGCILWVESILNDKEEHSLCYITDIKSKQLISFLSKQNGIEVYYTFQIKPKKNGLLSIIMKVNIKVAWYKSLVVRKRSVLRIVSYGWKQLDALDDVITTRKLKSIEEI